MSDIDLEQETLRPADAISESEDLPPTMSRATRFRPLSATVMFGRGLMLILGEMAQLILAFLLALFAIACCVALAVQANDAARIMGPDFTTPRPVVSMLGSLLTHSPTFLVLSLLVAIFGIKLLDLVVRVLRRRALLAEIGYPAIYRPIVQPETFAQRPLGRRSPMPRAKAIPNGEFRLRRKAAEPQQAAPPTPPTVVIQRSTAEAGGEEGNPSGPFTFGGTLR